MNCTYKSADERRSDGANRFKGVALISAALFFASSLSVSEASEISKNRTESSAKISTDQPLSGLIYRVRVNPAGGQLNAEVEHYSGHLWQPANLQLTQQKPIKKKQIPAIAPATDIKRKAPATTIELIIDPPGPRVWNW
ncbi:MAG: hypothetical protein ABJN62_09210 [Halioglobus sp.]